jgi:hypothetical protein
MSEIEEEVLYLESTLDALDELVNNYAFTVSGDEGDATVMFRDAAHQKMFNVLLLDFMKPVSGSLVETEERALDAVASIARSPRLGTAGASELYAAANRLQEWLSTSVEVEVHLASIDVSANMRVRRGEFIEVCGNIGKHNFARLTRVTEKVQSILKRSGVSVPFERAILTLDEFYERFHTDILSYHATTIVEMLNNLCWAIHGYLRPVYELHFKQEGGEPPRYGYSFPDGVRGPLAREWFWSLMNRVRRRPYLEPFRGAEILKLRY